MQSLMDKLINDVLLWTPLQGRAKARRPARTYIQQLCADTGSSPEDLPKAMNDRKGWRERVGNICTDSATWWWWWWWCILEKYFMYRPVIYIRASMTHFYEKISIECFHFRTQSCNAGFNISVLWVFCVFNFRNLRLRPNQHHILTSVLHLYFQS